MAAHLGQGRGVGGGLAQPQRVHQGAMHHQVGVAADGRGEVQVGGARQARVRGLIGAVHGLLQRAQHHGGQPRGTLARALHVQAHGMRGHPGGLAALLGGEHPVRQRRHGDAQHLQPVPQLLDGHLLGVGVHAVEDGHLPGDEEPGHGLVGRDHALLDEAV